jgi:anti-anti-sigma regulatory factor
MGTGETSQGRRHGAVTIGHDDSGPVLVLAGEVDLVAVRAFEDAHGAAEITVTALEAGEVTLLSATAVSLMLRVVNSARAGGRTVPLRRSNDHVDRVLRILGVAGSFTR